MQIFKLNSMRKMSKKPPTRWKVLRETNKKKMALHVSMFQIQSITMSKVKSLMSKTSSLERT